MEARALEHLISLEKGLVALALFFADSEQAHLGLYVALNVFGIDSPHDAELEELDCLAFDVCPHINHNGVSVNRGKEGGDGRPKDSLQGPKNQCGGGQGRTGVAGGEDGVGLSVLNHLHGHPDGRVLLATQSLGRRLVHTHHLGGVLDMHR